jgi:hypothetical protein
LYDERGELAALGAATGIVAFADEVFARHHLGDYETGAQSMHQTAKRQIGNARHWRKQHGRTQAMPANFDRPTG